ncbi:MAG: glycosyltransferase family 1 protein [Rikenellaceae bacterium]
MKIGFDAKRANANNTGLGNYSRFVISALAEYATSNCYQLYIPKRKENREYDQLYRDFPTLIEERLPSTSLWRTLSALWRTLTIKSDLEREGVEIFHGLSNEIPVGLDDSSVQSIVTIHDLIFLRYPSFYKPMDRWIYDLKFRYACQHSDHIIAVSERTKLDIVELYGIEPARISVIYQGCAPHFAEPQSAERQREVRTKYSLPDRYILNVGTLEERKNLLLCVKSLESLPEDIHLVAVGRATPYSEEVMRYAEWKGLSSRITLLHKCQYVDLPVVYSAAEVFLYPSLYEGFGIPIIEALNGGIPVVAATGSCLEEAGGDAATYVAPDDDKACAAAVAHFIEDRDYREESIAKGREYVKRFSKELIANEIESLYKEILSRQNP